MKRRVAALFTTVPLDARSTIPLHRQIYDRLRDAILKGNLAAGARLPSTRSLATELTISRNTVTTAFDQLLAEGYLESKTGSGTYVNEALPEELLHAVSGRRNASAASSKTPTLSRRGAGLARLPCPISVRKDEARAFQSGLPAVDAFPFDIWSRLVARRWRSSPRHLLGYGELAGFRPLREAIAGYLGTARGVRCTPEQVIVVASSQQAIDLAARVLLDPGDAVWIEDPGFRGARGALQAAGASLIAVPIDEEGLDVVAGSAREPDARLVYVCPSHQFPLGVTMTIARRLALLEWASKATAWVIEDDYDSEFRYAGQPLPALQGLDRQQRVIYIGSFSKVLFPSLRLGYLVVPPNLVEPLTTAKAAIDRHAISLDQAVLTDFMNEGHFARHIRRMRVLYAERHDTLIQATRGELSEWLEVSPGQAGIHVVGWLRNEADDTEACEQASVRGIVTLPLSSFCLERPRRGGLILGYGAIGNKQIREGAQLLAAALRSSVRKASASRTAKKAR